MSSSMQRHTSLAQLAQRSSDRRLLWLMQPLQETIVTQSTSRKSAFFMRPTRMNLTGFTVATLRRHSAFSTHTMLAVSRQFLTLAKTSTCRTSQDTTARRLSRTQATLQRGQRTREYWSQTWWRQARESSVRNRSKTATKTMDAWHHRAMRSYSCRELQWQRQMRLVQPLLFASFSGQTGRFSQLIWTVRQFEHWSSTHACSSQLEHWRQTRCSDMATLTFQASFRSTKTSASRSHIRSETASHRSRSTAKLLPNWMWNQTRWNCRSLFHTSIHWLTKGLIFHSLAI